MSLKTPQSNSGLSLPAITPGTSQVVASGASSAASTAIGASCVRLVCTADCWIKIGPTTPTANKTTSVFLPAGAIEYFGCLPTDLVAVIQDSASGTLCVTPAAEG